MSAMSDSDNQNFEAITLEQINQNDLIYLLEYFSKNTYFANSEDAEGNNILHRCLYLLKLDYVVSTINNSNGELCPNYPSQLPILENVNANIQNIPGSAKQLGQRTTNTIYESTCDVEEIRDICNRAKYARCRARFPIPVILFKGKYVCRSSTLSGGPEIYGRSGIEYIFYGSSEPQERPQDEEMGTVGEPDGQGDWPLCDRVRNQDIRLLEKFQIDTIIDLMVENKKKKYGFHVTSSEKVDKENRYSNFNIVSLPYPGCEFFRRVHENSYCPEGLFFDWNQYECDAVINVPESSFVSNLKIEWDNYKQWDLITMTQNYMKYLLKYLQECNSGILIHCISGWDRTPLFISLLRMSLWADGLIHQSLNALEILYLTLAYDWFLFGHHLYDRLNKREEILFFCFEMIKYLTSDEYKVSPGRQKPKKKKEEEEEEKEKTSAEPVKEDLANYDSQLELLIDCDRRASSASPVSMSSPGSWKLAETESETLHDDSNGNSTNVGLTVDVHDNLALGASASPQGRRTSPVFVPMGGRRKRSDSSTTTSSVLSTQSNNSNNSSSSGSGSWQVVTGTGSLKGSDSNSSVDIPIAHTSMDTVINQAMSNDLLMASDTKYTTIRERRLMEIRNIFYSCYFQICKVEYGPTERATLGAVISNIVEKVGFSQRN